MNRYAFGAPPMANGATTRLPLADSSVACALVPGRTGDVQLVVDTEGAGSVARATAVATGSWISAATRSAGLGRPTRATAVEKLHCSGVIPLSPGGSATVIDTVSP